ncbi:MAG: preprotein translocase subunit SecA, partial [Planctomycetaceae bacterium]|nr:preprotein translocase subunit SecA [Planctomycetaceae bacterium]
GLHVIGTERHDARRIDLQLRGRSGRQGDPGSSRFFLSLQDDLMRIFAGDRVTWILTKLGMQEGEAIESPMVTRQIEKAQKRVEERHFEARKNLLEYDEVMDHQRKAVYSYRQRILDGGNCRDLILDMIDKQVRKMTEQFLGDRYRWETCAAWASQGLGIQVDWSDIQGMDKQQLSEYLLDQTERQSEDIIRDQIDESLPKDVEERDWNWLALSGWANRQYGLNTSDRELKKIARPENDGEYDRDALYTYIIERAREAITRADLSPLDTFLADDFNRRTLCGWLRHQYGIEMTPQEFEKFENGDIDGPVELTNERVHTAYRNQEIKFPVSVAMYRFLGGRQLDRDGLLHWANNRFHSGLTEADIKEKERDQIAQRLLDVSQRYFPATDAVERLDQQLTAISETNGHSGNGHVSRSALQELSGLVSTEFGVQLDESKLEQLSGDQVRQNVLQGFDARYRPEFGHAERALLLEVLDHSWKEHLYYMDHLRQGIGLVGYAQKDPKVEYKREGMKAFEQMWERIGEQVTQAIFRLEKESPQFVGNLWQISAATHQQAASAAQEARQAPPPSPAAAPQQQESRGVEP